MDTSWEEFDAFYAEYGWKYVSSREGAFVVWKAARYSAIESYKAELLKEVVEPVLYAEFAEDGGWLGMASESADYLEEPHGLYTSDQVAAAVAKATGPLEEALELARSGFSKAASGHISQKFLEEHFEAVDNAIRGMK